MYLPCIRFIKIVEKRVQQVAHGTKKTHNIIILSNRNIINSKRQRQQKIQQKEHFCIANRKFIRFFSCDFSLSSTLFVVYFRFHCQFKSSKENKNNFLWEIYVNSDGKYNDA